MPDMRFLAAVLTAALALGTAFPAHAWDCASTTPATAETGRAAPRPETWWMKVAVDTNVAAKWQHPKVVFLGDSLTRRWPDNLWNMEFAPRHAANFGIDGDRAANILWRFNNSDPEVKTAPAFVILAGTNDLGAHASPQDTAEGVRTLLQAVRKTAPKARIILVGLLPRGFTNDKAMGHAVAAVNAQLKTCAAVPNVTYLDLTDLLQQPDLYQPDELHLSDLGYQAIMPRLGKALSHIGVPKTAKTQK